MAGGGCFADFGDVYPELLASERYSSLRVLASLRWIGPDEVAGLGRSFTHQLLSGREFMGLTGKTAGSHVWLCCCCSWLSSYLCSTFTLT